MLRIAFASLLLSAGPLSANTPAADPGVVVEITDIDSDSVGAALDQIRSAAPKTSVLWLRINSFGGGIYAGLDLIQGIEDIRKSNPPLEVRCVVDTRAMSMGAVLLESPACDRRLATPRSMLLFHNGRMPETGGDTDGLLEDVDTLNSLNQTMAEIVAPRIGLTTRQYLARIRDRSWIMTARQALALGVIDELVDPATLPAVAPPKPDGAGLLRRLLGG